MQPNIAMKFVVGPYMWPDSFYVNTVNLAKNYYNFRDIEFFLRDYFRRTLYIRISSSAVAPFTDGLSR